MNEVFLFRVVLQHLLLLLRLTLGQFEECCKMFQTLLSIAS